MAKNTRIRDFRHNKRSVDLNKEQGLEVWKLN